MSRNDTLKYIFHKYQLPDIYKLPIEIPNVGRNDLANLFKELKFTVGAEIGVERAHYSKTLCQANPDALIYGIDAWKHYNGYRDHVSQERQDQFYEESIERMKGYNWQAIRDYSVSALSYFADNSLDFVYIDGNHDFINVATDLYYWTKKVRNGGIISGHDYVIPKKKLPHIHTVHVVKAFTTSYQINPWFVLGRKEKIEGEIRESTRSFMWVVQK